MPIHIERTHKTQASYIDILTTNSGGCIVQLSGIQHEYQIKVSDPNYNTLFSHLLTCWANRNKVSLEIDAAINNRNRNVTTIKSIISYSSNTVGE